MTQFTVPFAAPWMWVVMGIPLAIAFLGGTRWSLKNLVTCIQIARGVKPRPASVPSQSYVLAGMLIFAALTAFSLWCGFFLLALVTTKPTLVTDRGITAGGGPLAGARVRIADLIPPIERTTDPTRQDDLDTVQVNYTG